MADEHDGPFENVALQAIAKQLPPEAPLTRVIELDAVREETIREAWAAICVDLTRYGMAMVNLGLDGHVQHVQRAHWNRFESAARDTVRPYDFTT